MHSSISGTSLLAAGWTICFAGVSPGERQMAGMGFLIALLLSAFILEFTLVTKRIKSQVQVEMGFFHSVARLNHRDLVRSSGIMERLKVSS